MTLTQNVNLWLLVRLYYYFPGAGILIELNLIVSQWLSNFNAKLKKNCLIFRLHQNIVAQIVLSGWRLLSQKNKEDESQILPSRHLQPIDWFRISTRKWLMAGRVCTECLSASVNNFLVRHYRFKIKSKTSLSCLPAKGKRNLGVSSYPPSWVGLATGLEVWEMTVDTWGDVIWREVPVNGFCNRVVLTRHEPFMGKQEADRVKARQQV